MPCQKKIWNSNKRRYRKDYRDKAQLMAYHIGLKRLNHEVSSHNYTTLLNTSFVNHISNSEGGE